MDGLKKVVVKQTIKAKSADENKDEKDEPPKASRRPRFRARKQPLLPDAGILEVIKDSSVDFAISRVVPYEFIQIWAMLLEKIFGLTLSTLSMTGAQRGKMASIPSLLQLWNSQTAFLLRQKTTIEQNVSVKLIPGGQVVTYDLQTKQEAFSRINKIRVTEPRLVVRRFSGIHEYMNEDGSKGRTQPFVAQCEDVAGDPDPGQLWTGVNASFDGRLALSERLEFATAISPREASLMIVFLVNGEGFNNARTYTPHPSGPFWVGESWRAEPSRQVRVFSLIVGGIQAICNSCASKEFGRSDYGFAKRPRLNDLDAHVQLVP